MLSLIEETREIFQRWELSASEQLAVLGQSADADFDRLSELEDQNSTQLIARCACLIALDRALTVLYPSQPLANRWLSQPNTHGFFNQQTPLDLLKTGELESLRYISQLMTAWSAGNG